MSMYGQLRLLFLPFQSSFDLGVSLMDEVMKALTTTSSTSSFNRSGGEGQNDGSRRSTDMMPPPETPNEAHNVRNELREMENRVENHHHQQKKKQQATVKPISSSDQKKLDSAITMTKELASRSMQELAMKDPDVSPSPSPTATGDGRNSPNKKKFSFKFPSSATGVLPFAKGSSGNGNTSPTHHNGNAGGSNRHHHHHHYQNDRGSVDDLQENLSEEAKEAYNALVERSGSVFNKSGPGAGVLATAVPAMVTPTTTSVGVVHPRRNNNVGRHSMQIGNGTASLGRQSNGNGGVDDGDGDADDDNPLRRLRTGGGFVVPKIRGNKHGSVGNAGSFNVPGIRTLDR